MLIEARRYEQMKQCEQLSSNKQLAGSGLCDAEQIFSGQVCCWDKGEVKRLTTSGEAEKGTSECKVGVG